jgi:RNA polymerase sigma factor (sigma-70 family)
MSTVPLSAIVGCVHRLAGLDTRALNDRQLLDRFTGERDEAAFAELVRRHGPMVLSACRRVLRHEQDAEDAFQAAFLVLVRKAAFVRQGDTVAGWLHRVAHRLALRALNKERRHERCAVPAGEQAAPLAPSTPLQAALDEEVQRLPEPYRSAVVLCYLEGRTQAEAARALATTAAAVNSRLKRARDLLRRRLARHGSLAGALTTGPAPAAPPPELVRLTAHFAWNYLTGPLSACGAPPLVAALAEGALHGMTPWKNKIVLAGLALFTALLTVAALTVAAPAPGEGPAPAAGPRPRPEAAAERPLPAEEKARPRRACIILWMSGGPSQIDTFDPKPGHANGGPFKAIRTSAPGVQISENLPQLARVAHHLALFRTLTHRHGDHAGAAHLMRTGYEPGGRIDHPTLGNVLAKELGDGIGDLPRYVSIGPRGPAFLAPRGPGFLGPRYAPLLVEDGREGGPALPPAEAFEALEKGKGEALRKGVARAFELGQEKEIVRDAYGRGQFGQGCLLARRLVEAGVPVVEIVLGGWDMHANLPAGLPPLAAELDAGLAALLKDLHDVKRLDSTLVVWMGEFGRTPQINQQQGRDHWPACFTAVLAGGGIKGGQAIGKTSADGLEITERPVTPAELLATAYQALGIDPARENLTPAGDKVPLVEKGARPVKEALR